MRKTLLRIFTIADYEEEERWLRTRHRNGWKLVRMIPPCFYIFESCKPEDVIYRLDYKNSEQTPEYMQMLEDFGWEYFAHCTGWLYFRKSAGAVDSDEEGELFSDNISRVEMVKHIVKTRLLPLSVIFLCCVIPNFMRYANNDSSGGLSIFFGCFFGVMFVLYLFLIVYCGIKLARIRRRYET